MKTEYIIIGFVAVVLTLCGAMDLLAGVLS
jgi:hypothetical protein